MALSDEGKGFIVFISIIVVAILLIITFVGLFAPIEYSANCSISGVNTGVDKEMNFTGFNLNNSEIKCDVSGEVPLAFILSGLK